MCEVSAKCDRDRRGSVTRGLIPPSIPARRILVTVLSTGVSLPLFCDPLWITYPKIVPVPSYGFCGLSVLSLYVSSADRLSPQAPPVVGYPKNLGVVSGSCVLTLGGPSRRLQTVLLSRSGLCAGAEAALASFRADAAGLCTRPCLPPWFVYPSLPPSFDTKRLSHDAPGPRRDERDRGGQDQGGGPISE